ncbi:hypothetical protein EJ06DRAFT_530410 [Trichodelitschia bisporula]|uniref:DNA mismatch repair protein MutL n=1 Tax=Trichodelitschia bisporula TaxID=703511 RepID=A0A6G1HX71_9PEZI|nr:hypothetical protein EJ06DRAFT_530410 [Trichodelitschia bisporula]
MPFDVHADPASLSIPTPTAQRLTSTQLLATPASAVKELIDNALDARASSVALRSQPTPST